MLPKLSTIVSLFLVPSALCQPTHTNGSTSTYPTKGEISGIFSKLTGANPSTLAFFAHVSPTVNWTIEGTHPAAGMYTNRTVLEATFARISSTGSKENPLEVSLINIIGGGDEEWSVEELRVYGICKNGLIFDNRYAWATRWDTDKTIVEARAYLDSALVSAALQQNELGTLFTYSDPRSSFLPFSELPQSALDETTGLSHQ